MRLSWIGALLFPLVVTSCGPRDELEDHDAGTPVTDGSVVQPRILVRVVIDGDTIIVSASSTLMTPDNRPMNGETIRLIGVDAPEIEHPPQPADCWGDEAKMFAVSQVQGRQITLEYDQNNGYRDTYDRLLGYVMFKDGQGQTANLNESLLTTGNARVLSGFPHRESARFRTLESEARAANLGLWSCP